MTHKISGIITEYDHRTGTGHILLYDSHIKTTIFYFTSFDSGLIPRLPKEGDEVEVVFGNKSLLPLAVYAKNRKLL